MMTEESLTVKGNRTVLNRPMVALFCSVKCPGKMILETYDLARRLRNEGIVVISSFHSPMEQECLRILLRSPTPVIWCLARGMYRRIPTTPVDCREAVNEGRLILVTTFPDTVRYMTEETATARNRLVADLAEAVVIAHATPGGKMAALQEYAQSKRKPVYTFADPANAHLLNAGAKLVSELFTESTPFTIEPVHRNGGPSHG